MKKTSGFLIIEVLLAILILSMIFISLFSMLSFTANRTERSKFDVKAAALMQQGIEVGRSSLLSSWDSFNSGTYHPVFDVGANKWEIKAGAEGTLEGKFTRELTLSSVCRDTLSGKQVNCPQGKVDTQSKKIKAKVMWEEVGKEKTIEAELLVFSTKKP